MLLPSCTASCRRYEKYLRLRITQGCYHGSFPVVPRKSGSGATSLQGAVRRHPMSSSIVEDNLQPLDTEPGHHVDSNGGTTALPSSMQPQGNSLRLPETAKAVGTASGTVMEENSARFHHGIAEELLHNMTHQPLPSSTGSAAAHTQEAQAPGKSNLQSPGAPRSSPIPIAEVRVFSGIDHPALRSR